MPMFMLLWWIVMLILIMGGNEDYQFLVKCGWCLGGWFCYVAWREHKELKDLKRNPREFHVDTLQEPVYVSQEREVATYVQEDKTTKSEPSFAPKVKIKIDEKILQRISKISPPSGYKNVNQARKAIEKLSECIQDVLCDVTALHESKKINDTAIKFFNFTGKCNVVDKGLLLDLDVEDIYDNELYDCDEDDDCDDDYIDLNYHIFIDLNHNYEIKKRPSEDNEIRTQIVVNFMEQIFLQLVSEKMISNLVKWKGELDNYDYIDF